MINSFARLIDGTCTTLRAEVLSRIDDEYARGQVWGVINLLHTLKVRGDWSAGFLQQQVEAQRQALASAAVLLHGVADAPLQREPEPWPMAPPAADAAELLVVRDEGNRQIAARLDWLAAPPAGVDAAVLAAAEAALLMALRAEVDLELKHSPRPLFAQMSGAAEG